MQKIKVGGGMENRKLTKKQKRFCDYYIENPNATQAAIKAGYSKNSAKAIGHENLTKPYLAKYINDRNKQLEDARIADMKEVKEFWTNTMRGPRIDHKDRLKASEYLAKTNGAFLDRVEHSGSVEVVDKQNLIDKYLSDKNGE